MVSASLVSVLFTLLAAPSVALPASEASAAPLPETAEYWSWRDARDSARIRRDDELGGLAALGMKLSVTGSPPLSVTDLSPQLQRALASWDGEGALVLDVVPGSPADGAGLLPGDVVVGFAGIWIDTPSLLQRLVSRSQPGREYELAILRDDEVTRTWAVPVTRRAIADLAPRSR